MLEPGGIPYSNVIEFQVWQILQEPLFSSLQIVIDSVKMILESMLTCGIPE